MLAASANWSCAKKFLICQINASLRLGGSAKTLFGRLVFSRLAILNAGRVVALGTPAELKSEIGGDVIEIEALNAEELAQQIQKRFRVQAEVVDGRVRLENAQGHRVAAEIIEAFPGQATSVSISKPRLEDVFIRHTGHRFWSESETRASRP